MGFEGSRLRMRGTMRQALIYSDAGPGRAATEEMTMTGSERDRRLVPLPPPFAGGMSDAELVKAVSTGSTTALRAVWDRYVTSVRSTLRSCLGSDPIIDDLVQEVFLSFHRSATVIRDPSALRAYLVGTAARAASLEIRSRSRRGRWYRLFHWAVKDATSGPIVEERDALRSLHDVLTRLPARAREAFVLRYVQDLTPGEVAQALGISEGSAKRAITQGRRRVVFWAEREAALAPYLRSFRERS
jgi:RNA polymerase sigma factor (sigma-70 family)